MSLRKVLQEFSTDGSSVEVSEKAAIAEAAHAEGYESGYNSGWEDAVAAERKRRGHMDAEFERCIQDLGFTYHEAVDQVRSELAIFLTELIDALFPAVIPDLLRETIKTETVELAEGHLNPVVKLMASETIVEQLQEMVPESSLEISVESEDSLAPQQAFISLAGQERVIDFQPLVEAIRQQLGAINAPAVPEVSNE